MTDSELQANITSMVEDIIKNVSFVQFGEVSFCLKIHDGRIVSATHSMTKNTIKNEGNKKR
jgi:hypothetical protein